MNAGETGDPVLETPTPRTWQEALRGEHAAEWAESMSRELRGLQATKTYRLVPRSAARNIIRSKWVYKVKRTITSLPLFKSRLVAKGFTQRQGVDFHETWAPTAKPATARTLLHLAAALDLEIHAMDVDQAFLQGDLEEKIYMEPPEGLGTADPNIVWELQRPIYGLKQAPRQWHTKLKSALLEMGFHCSMADPSLFLKQGPSGTWVLVYVDDLLVMAPTLQLLQETKEHLHSQFPLKDLGPITSYLGMEVTRDRGSRTISLCQGHYITQILHRFRDHGIKSYKTPLPVNCDLRLPSEAEDCPPEVDRYPELVGCLMYLMTCTRPDLAYPLSLLGRYVAPGRHGLDHWKMALRVLGYVEHTKDRSLTLGGPDITLQGYTDASWADCKDDRRSSQGYCFTLGSGMISWRATRSPAVALSSCEAELYGGAAAAQELMWLKRLLSELGHSQDRPTLWCDNSSTVQLTKDPVFSGRSKHIEARYFFIRELSQAHLLQVQHIAGAVNPADVFTKPLLRDRHELMLQLLGLPSGSPLS